MVGTPPPSPTFIKRSLKPWAQLGLDLSNSTFSKLYLQEEKPIEEKYNLKSELWENFKRILLDKAVRCCLNSILTITNDDSKDCNIITEFSLLTEANVKAAQQDIWTAVKTSNTEKFTQQDNRIKSQLLGTFLLESLTVAARKTIDRTKSKWTLTSDGETFRHGPSILWHIAQEVKPDNGHLIDQLKVKLRSLHVKEFGFSIKTLLTEFDSISEEIGDLGGEYLEDEKQLDFWRATKTMEEKEWSRYVNDQHDQYRELPKSGRTKISDLITKFKKKQTNMENDQKWNKISASDAQILALTSLLLSKSDDASNSNRRKRNNKKKSDDTSSPPPASPSAKDKPTFVYPEWRTTAPADGEDTTKEVDGKTYHWCSKDHGRTKGGLWGNHKEEDHKAPRGSSPHKKNDY